MPTTPFLDRKKQIQACGIQLATAQRLGQLLTYRPWLVSRMVISSYKFPNNGEGLKYALDG